MATDPLDAYGFKRYDQAPADRRRVVWSLEGPTKTGKTFWPLRELPGPILYQDIDLGAEGVADAIIKERGDVRLGSTPTGRYEYADNIQNTKEMVRAAAGTVWTPFVKDYYNALASSLKPGGIRSIIWDTGTDFWDLCLNYTQGKEVKLMPEERTTANNLFKRMIKAAYSHSANLIIVHHMMPAFDNPSVMERKGFNRMHTLVDASIETSATRDRRSREWSFAGTITLCRRDRKLEGEKFDFGTLDAEGEVERGIDFATIAAVVTGTRPREWR
jgi:hypothetical protein